MKLPKYYLQETSIIKPPANMSKAVKHGLHMFLRDMKNVFGKEPIVDGAHKKATFVIQYADELNGEPESFSITFQEDNEQVILVLSGADDLGIIFGLLHISKEYLHIDPFWFWVDKPVERKERISIPTENFVSPKKAVRFRGWFVNDEVCLLGWKDEYPPTEEVWKPVFETLLRCGGNMVIPGTDLPRDGIHHKLASEMGLWVTHHHAEPLGAEMFLRAYPGKKASYENNKELFEQLWMEAIEKQKDDKIVWVLSFRGQGDQPFWELDPSYDTSEKRGEMISKVIWRQYHLLQEYIEDPVCSIALYGEISELYTGGFIDLPPNVIKVWADNGYGKMVSRRQGLENPRIPSLPAEQDVGEHGIYYHVTFHDLQASNHLTMSPFSADFIGKEVTKALNAGTDDYVLVNSGNIRQHVYTLDILSQLWNEGNINNKIHLDQFVQRMFSSRHEKVAELYNKYFEASIPYGDNEDERAGEQFYHHPARRIIGKWITGKTDETILPLTWATGYVNFEEQIRYFKEKCELGIEQWSELKSQCLELMEELVGEEKTRFYDQLVFPIELHESGSKGFVDLCKAYNEFEKGNFPLAFVYASQSLWEYQKGVDAQKRTEHGKWKNFYRMDYLTNIQSTVDNVDTLRRFIRMHGDSPDFFQWYKQYIMPETEKYIYLENTHREVKSDDVLAKLLKEKFQEEGILY
ncbi:glycosyl hydrolase 115 family protein [Evansella sp. AB-rgal1]|uniref:glycosyl hydrolase 115 family protein n=1 Tax=Evansella sp. AB-rgal1 TaxID=3242696 RepID=UPI00359ECAEB